MAEMNNLANSATGYKNIRDFIQDFYTIYPTIRSQVAQILPYDNTVDNAKKPVVDIEAIARKIGIMEILYVQPEAVGNKHSQLLENDIILLNKEDSLMEQRFSIAHDIAFFLSKDNTSNIPFVVRTVNKQWEYLNENLVSTNEFDIRRMKPGFHMEMEKAIEKEVADYFAANLLVPTERFILWEDKTDEEIARAFCVSVSCIQKRRLEIKKENEINLKDTMNRVIKVSRGNVVGIGKVKIPKTLAFNHEIQLLSFLDIQESKTSFVSTCIHLHVDGYGKTVEEAEEDMVENIYYFLSQNFSKLSPESAWENLRNLFKSNEWSNELWDAYHEVQIQLSINGISTDKSAELIKRLKNLEDRVKELETSVKTEELHVVRRIKLASGDVRKLARDLIVDKRPYWGGAAI